MTLSSQKDKFKYLGVPGDTANLTKIRVSMRLSLSWKPDFYITQFTCHKIIAPHLVAIFAKISKLDPTLIHRFGCTIFGGCYEFRAIRASNSKTNPPFSTHAWGAAVDIDPEHNGLYTKAPQALLSHADAAPIHYIWERHGFTNLGKHIGRDFMHFEASLELISNPSKFL